jgi:hypothetical protein
MWDVCIAASYVIAHSSKEPYLLRNALGAADFGYDWPPKTAGQRQLLISIITAPYGALHGTYLPPSCSGDVPWVSLICLTGNQAQQLLRPPGPQTWNSISRKPGFAERIQVDLGRPVLSAKIIHFSG